MTIAKTLSGLEAALKKSYPAKLAALAPPLSKKQIASFEKGIGFKLLSDVIELYSWRGGGEGFLVDKDSGASEDGWSWSSPEAVVADYRIWSKLRPKGWKPTWLPLFTNGAGDNVCLDVEDGRLVSLFHENPSDRQVIALSLEAALAYVLSRVKAGKWRGAPESKQVSRLLAKLEKPIDSVSDFFGNDVFRLLESDPRSALLVIDAAERKGIDRTTVLDSRILALLNLDDADSAYKAFQQYLAAAREKGSTYNPPFHSLLAAFEKLKKKAWAEEVKEIIELNEAHYLYRWLNVTGAKSKREKQKVLLELIESLDRDIKGSTPEEELRNYLKRGFSEEKARARVDQLVKAGELGGAKGEALARAAVLKAAALRELGKKVDSEKCWKQAAAADAKIAAFWKAHPLLA